MAGEMEFTATVDDVEGCTANAFKLSKTNLIFRHTNRAILFDHTTWYPPHYHLSDQ